MKDYKSHKDSMFTNIIGDKTVCKDSPLIEAIGSVDELNSVLGIARSLSADREIREVIKDIQKDLLVIGADLAKQDSEAEKQERGTLTIMHVKRMEGLIETFENELPPLKNFILPAGSPASSSLHLARALCRRTERKIVTASKQGRVNKEIFRYFNRLSDLLFCLARLSNKREGREEEIWK